MLHVHGGMDVSIKKEVLQRLRNGDSFKEVRRSTSSQSQFYAAVQEFFEEAEKTVTEKQEKLRKINKKLAHAKEEAEKSSLEKKQISSEISQLSMRHKELMRKVSTEENQLDQLRSAIKKLEVRGFTPKIVKKIIQIEERSGPDLLHQVETVEKFTRIENNILSLREEEKSLKGKLPRGNKTLSVIRGKITSERNVLDELKIKTGTYHKAVDTVLVFLEDGYSVEDVVSLKYGLDMLQIKGDPRLSVARLIQGLSDQKNLLALKTEISKGRVELSHLDSAKAEAESRLSISECVVENIKQVKHSAIEAIHETAKLTAQNVENSQAAFDAHSIELLGKIDDYVKNNISSNLSDWSKLAQEMGSMEREIKWARILLGILESPEYLKEIPLSLVVQLFKRLHLWILIHFPDGPEQFVSPSQNIQKKDFNLLTWNLYRLPVLVELVCEKLEATMHST